MSRAETQMPTKSFRWDGEDDFVDTLRELQSSGYIPENVSRSEAMRAVLDNWSENPDTTIFK